MRQSFLALVALCLLFPLMMSCGRGGSESGSLERIPIPTLLVAPETPSGVYGRDSRCLNKDSTGKRYVDLPPHKVLAVLT